MGTSLLLKTLSSYGDYQHGLQQDSRKAKLEDMITTPCMIATSLQVNNRIIRGTIKLPVLVCSSPHIAFPVVLAKLQILRGEGTS